MAHSSLSTFLQKVDRQRVEKRTIKQWVGRKSGRKESRGSKKKEGRGSRHGNITVRSHGRLEKRAPFINASSQSQHEGTQQPDH